jgi:hypothetical protein
MMSEPPKGKTDLEMLYDDSDQEDKTTENKTSNAQT